MVDTSRKWRRPMYAVVGLWSTDPARAELQRRGLQEIVAGVRQARGLISGRWAAAPGGSRSHTFVEFADQSDAERFAASVIGNARDQERVGVTLVSLDVVEVIATT
jgi:hypothetical protein